jgi:hypothetical protein
MSRFWPLVQRSIVARGRTPEGVQVALQQVVLVAPALGYPIARCRQEMYRYMVQSMFHPDRLLPIAPEDECYASLSGAFKATDVLLAHMATVMAEPRSAWYRDVRTGIQALHRSIMPGRIVSL